MQTQWVIEVQRVGQGDRDDFDNPVSTGSWLRGRDVEEFLLPLWGTNCKINKAATRDKGQSAPAAVRPALLRSLGLRTPASRQQGDPNLPLASRPARPLCGETGLLCVIFGNWEYVEELSFRLNIASRSPGQHSYGYSDLDKECSPSAHTTGDALPRSQAA